MKSLLLVSHGSRRAASNDEVRELAMRVGKRASADFADTRCAFLELAEPSIPDGIQQCIDAGADEVVVLPYFLSAGRHVVEDIPAEVAVKQDQYPHLNIRIAPHIGAADGMVDLLLSANG